MTERAAGPRPVVEVIELPRAARGRPGGPRFGELVHAVLATVELDADGTQVGAVVRGQSRLLGATEEEAEAAMDIASSALAHPLLRRAAAAAKAGALRREVPVFHRAGDGRLVEGVADLAFREEGAPGMAASRGGAEKAASRGGPEKAAGRGGPDGGDGRHAGEAGPRWTVVDFKTDREVEGSRAAYEEQVRIYATVIAQTTGEPARGVLLVL